MSAPMPTVLQPVRSSQIAGIGYDAEARALSVLFKNRDGSAGSLYRYDSVSAEQYAELAGAASVGAHFAATIKRNADAHPFVKLDSARAVFAGEAVSS